MGKLTMAGSWRLAVLTAGMLAVLAVSGCCNIFPQPGPAPTPVPQPNVTCSDAGCFIEAANDCEDMNLTLIGDVGTFAYSSSEYCVFTKTLVSLGANESQAMKGFLEGRNMTCTYERGEFNPAWVTSLIGGMEYCHGDLKDRLGELLIFT